MRRIHLFNPDHDLALAQGSDHYIAPPFARQLQHDLAALPLWYAREGDCVVVPDEATAHWVSAQGRGVEGITPAMLPHCEGELWPWGWNAVERKRLLRAGVAESRLPSAQSLAQLCALSHRRTSIAIHQRLNGLLGVQFSPTPQELHTLQEVLDFAQAHHGCYVKLPWSGSGHGVLRLTDTHDTRSVQWCRGGLRRQGSLLCEVGLHRTLDFALEFCCGNGQVSLLGYSVFGSDRHSQYSTGLVGSKERLHGLIAQHCPQIDHIAHGLTQVLNDLIPHDYHGHLGVDMLTYVDSQGQEGIDPCVELNLRATMGVVTSALGQQGMQGRFAIESSPTGFSSSNFLRLLTPVTADTHYRAILLRS